MGAGRVYWGQLAAVLGALALGFVTASQWTADALGRQAALGPPDALVFGAPFYAPWRFFVWWFQFDAYARPIFERGALILLGSCLASIALAFGFSLWRSRDERRARTYGTARWATASDIRRLGLTRGDGVVLGHFGRELLTHDGDEHVLVIAPTNTGKSAGISIPTGLVWRGSLLALDLKGEAWRATAGARARFGAVVRFAPGEPGSHRYNPLTGVRRGLYEVRDAQVLADMLVDPEGALGPRTHWQNRAFELLVAAILWTLYAEPKKSLTRLAEILADPSRPIPRLLEAWLHAPIKDGAPHPIVAAGARQLLDMADAERSGVVSTALGYLALYRDPVLARALEASDFAIEDLVRPEAPVSVYLVTPPEELSRLKPLLRLMFAQMLNRLTDLQGKAIAESGRTDAQRVLLLLDEFPQLGRLDFLERALAYIRGYRIKACLVAQSLNQIAQAYGPDSAILDNAHIRVAFACNDERTAKRISDMLGVATETRAQMNYAGSRMAPWLGHTMVSRQEAARPLLTPGEVMQLPPEEALILVGGSPPIRARKVRYWREPMFTARLRPEPDTGSPRAPITPRPTPWDDCLGVFAARPARTKDGASRPATFTPAPPRPPVGAIAAKADPRQTSFAFVADPGASTEGPMSAPAVSGATPAQAPHAALATVADLAVDQGALGPDGTTAGTDDRQDADGPARTAQRAFGLGDAFDSDFGELL